MPTHLDHPVDYDDANRRIARHEHQISRSLWAFALAIIVAAAIWLAFYRYV